MSVKTKKKVFLIDDHPTLCRGLKELIDHEKDLTVCGLVDDAPRALEAIKTTRPDIVVSDLTLKDSNALELVKDIKIRYGALPVLILSMHDENLYAERCLRAGARGYITKDETIENILQAIRRVLNGDIHLSTQISSRVLKKAVGAANGHTDPIDTLSDRELEVFRLIGRGLRTADIAECLHLSIKTIETYREHIKIKLHLENAARLTQYAVQWVQSQKLWC